jgi:hypothetical protein
MLGRLLHTELLSCSLSSGLSVNISGSFSSPRGSQQHATSVGTLATLGYLVSWSTTMANKAVGHGEHCRAGCSSRHGPCIPRARSARSADSNVRAGAATRGLRMRRPGNHRVVVYSKGGRLPAPAPALPAAHAPWVIFVSTVARSRLPIWCL